MSGYDNADTMMQERQRLAGVYSAMSDEELEQNRR